ncbi:flagellar hook-associated protein FlgL [Pseudomonas aeruginosa]|nr:flagellar hook-associated protein FlgL [Pseudomonas aeruginosa]
MRISTIQAFNNSVNGISRNYADLNRTFEQISTGKRILTPADDPVGSVRLLRLDQEQGLNEQYKTGMTEAKNSLSQEETILRSVGNVLQRIREIAGQAGDGALDSNDKKSLASELRQREDELLNLLNSRDASGKYLFSGSQGSVQPFVRNEDGTYSYMGDESQREVQIASSTRIPVSDSGKVLFEDIVNAARLDTKAAAGNTGDGRISVGLVEDELAFDSQFPASNPPAATDGFNIHFVSDKEYVVYDPKSLPPGYDWTTYDPNSPPAWQLSKGAIDDDPKTIDKVLYAGVSVTIDGTPKAGDEFNVNYKPGSEKRSLLNVVSDLRKALESSTDNQAGNDAIRDATAVALPNLSAVAAAVDGGQGKIGARLNTVESTETFIDDVKLVNASVMSQIQDLDYAEALSRLSLQSTIMDAAQQSYVKIQGLSLFNYLK